MTVDPDHWEILQIFRDLSDQWRFRPDGMPTGLEASAVMDWLRTIQCDDIPTTYRKLRIMVTGAVNAIAEQRKNV